MPKTANYADKEILLALIWTMPKRLTKGQIGRLLGIKSAGQKHWRERLEKLGEKNLLSIETLDVGDLFSGSPILKYYLSEANLEAIWRQYFINNENSDGWANDPFLTPFSAGHWNVTSSPGFSKLVGSKFNYFFLCAKNAANPISSTARIRSVNKEKTWKIMDAVLSVGWKMEAYRRKPVLIEITNPAQKKTYDQIMSLYEMQIKAHPADYRKFKEFFEKNFGPLFQKDFKSTR